MFCHLPSWGEWYWGYGCQYLPAVAEVLPEEGGINNPYSVAVFTVFALFGLLVMKCGPRMYSLICHSLWQTTIMGAEGLWWRKLRRATTFLNVLMLSLQSKISPQQELGGEHAWIRSMNTSTGKMRAFALSVQHACGSQTTKRFISDSNVDPKGSKDNKHPEQHFGKCV